MFITGHTTVGLTIGYVTGDPVTAFFSGWLSHYLFDIIPHGDEIKFKDISLRGMAHLAIFDHAVALVLIFIFVNTTSLVLTPAVALGIIGAILPDWIMALNRLAGALAEKTSKGHVVHAPAARINHLTNPLQEFHNWCHCNVIRFEIPFWLGLLYQFVVIGGVWWWL